MAELPFLPIATDAYLADCDHLTDAEHGRYFLMLMALWRAPGQRLPNDDAWLARKFRRSVEEVKRDLRPLICEFCDCDGNWITQKRLSREFKRASKSVKQRSEAAKSRWKKKKEESGRNAETPYGRNTPTPTPTPTPTIEEKTLSQGAGRAGIIPKEWSPSEELMAWARKARPDVPEARLKLELEGFKAHAKSNNRHSHDWDQAARGWVLKIRIPNMEPSSHGQPSPGGQGARPLDRRRTAAENKALLAAAFGGTRDS